MKRYGNLWKDMICFEALLQAAQQARRGKRHRPVVSSFEFHLERELCRLHHELSHKTWRPGPYRSFFIHEPKKRQISAAPYRDRVVHHALVGVLEPVFERGFIADSYACRRGKGTHAAVHRCQEFSRQYRYVLKADIRKFFPTMDHQILKDRIARKIKDPDVMWLVGEIIDGSNPQEVVPQLFPGDTLFTSFERRRGIPIGNQTSQFFSNVYLDALDHFVKDRLGMKGYVRYVDDFLVFSDDKNELAKVREDIRSFLVSLRLRLHPRKSVISAVANGIRFLGFRIFPTHRLLPKDNVRRFRRRMKALQNAYATGEVSLPEIQQRMMSWSGHACQADTWHLRSTLFAEMLFCRAANQ